MIDILVWDTNIYDRYISLRYIYIYDRYICLAMFFSQLTRYQKLINAKNWIICKVKTKYIVDITRHDLFTKITMNQKLNNLWSKH